MDSEALNCYNSRQPYENQSTRKKGSRHQADSPLTPLKLTATTATTATELAREFDFLHVILCFAEVSVFFIKNNILAVHPAAQSRLAVALLSATEPHVAVLLAGEAVGQQVEQVLRTGSSLGS
jgi:hypothetical protein